MTSTDQGDRLVEPRDHLAAVLRRWHWVAAAGLVGAVLAVAVAMAATPRFESRTVLFVGVTRAADPGDLSTGSLVRREVLPSLVQLVRSSAVLTPVVDGLALPTTAGELARDVDVSVPEDASQLVVTVSAEDPETARLIAAAVGESVRTAVSELTGVGSADDPLALTTVTPAPEPRYQSAPDEKFLAALGLLGGSTAATLAIGLVSLARRPVRGPGDLGSAPVLGQLVRRPRRPTRAGAHERSQEVQRLGWLLSAPLPPAARLLVVGTARPGSGPSGAELLAGELAAAGLSAVAAEETADLRNAAAPDRVVVLVDVRRSGRDRLADVLDRVGASPAQLLGVVLDGLPAPSPGRAGRLWDLVRPGPAWRSGGSPSPAPSAGPAPALLSTRLTAVVALALLGLDPALPKGMAISFLVPLLLLPVWLPALPRYRGATALGLLTLLAVLCGGVLALRSSLDHALDGREALISSTMVLGAAGTIGLVAWARTVLPLPWLGAAFGAGMLVSGLSRVAGSPNAWKFELALPLTILVLSLAMASGRHALSLAGLLVLGAADITHDSRSAFGFCTAAAALVVWQIRTGQPGRTGTAGRTGRPLLTAVVLAVLAVGGYQAATHLLTSGALGAEVQARSVTQVEDSGSLLIGGRPEWTATWALMQEEPLGFGLGVVPTGGDVLTAKTGFAVAHIPTGDNYIENYLLAGRFELHSIVADLWTNLGVAGLALGVGMAAAVVAGFAVALSRRRAPALVCFLALISLWDLAFGPLPSNIPEVALTVGLLLLPAPDRSSRSPHDRAAGSAAPQPALAGAHR
jgi:capsular polysaccharide biosynthesis protein